MLIAASHRSHRPARHQTSWSAPISIYLSDTHTPTTHPVHTQHTHDTRHTHHTHAHISSNYRSISVRLFVGSVSRRDRQRTYLDHFRSWLVSHSLGPLLWLAKSLQVFTQFRLVRFYSFFCFLISFVSAFLPPIRPPAN